MTDVSRAADWATLAIAFSIVALTLSSVRVRRNPIAARSWHFFGLASLTLLAHASFALMGGAYAAAASVAQLATAALLGGGFMALYGADRDGVQAVQRQAEEDTLTGLMNLRSFRAAAEQRVARTVEHAGHCAVAVLDLDGFKGVNDTKGHPAGDRVLRAVARAINTSLRTADLAARYGGDEFVIFLDRCDRLEARRIAQRIRWSVEVLTTAEGSRVSLSCGVAVCPESGTDIDTLIHKADEMLLAVKRGGKNDVKLANGA